MCLWLSFDLPTLGFLYSIPVLVDENFCFCSSLQLSHFFNLVILQFLTIKCFIIITILLLFTIECTATCCPFLNNSSGKSIIVTFYFFSCFLYISAHTSSHPPEFSEAVFSTNLHPIKPLFPPGNIPLGVSSLSSCPNLS